MRIPIKVYEDFPYDWKLLSPAARRDLGLLLEQLQANPYDPDLLKLCEADSDEAYARRLPDDFVAHWKVFCRNTVDPISIELADQDAMEVELLAIRKEKV
jgi:hypothetical protein